MSHFNKPAAYQNFGSYLVFLKESGQLSYNPGQDIQGGIEKSSKRKGKGNGGQPMALPKFEIFLIFSNFLRS